MRSHLSIFAASTALLLTSACGGLVSPAPAQATGVAPVATPTVPSAVPTANAPANDANSVTHGNDNSATDANNTSDTNSTAVNANTTAGDTNTVSDTNTTTADGNNASNANSVTNANTCVSDPTISAADEIFITKLSVVEDATRTVWTGSSATSQDGAWSMGRLLANVANGQNANAFARNWFALWQSAQTVNGQSVAARSAITTKVLNVWPKLANGSDLDLTQAPFRLLAITNRIDLRQPAAGSAGELRFIYGLTDANGNPQPFTVIFEFNMPITAAHDVLAWATAWHALSSQTGDTSAYNQALQNITDIVTAANSQPGRPDNSALFRVRTNENALNPSWEMRQFEVNSAGALAEVSVTATPSLSVNQTSTFVAFINQNANAIMDGNLSVPANFSGQPFAAGSILTLAISGGPTNPQWRPADNNPNNIAATIAEWMGTGIENNDARAIVSLNTCNGCHGGETLTPFLHVTSRQKGQVSQLSGFLTGETVLDPANPNTTRSYGDLARRSNEMVQVLCHGAASTQGTGIEARPSGI